MKPNRDAELMGSDFTEVLKAEAPAFCSRVSQGDKQGGSNYLYRSLCQLKVIFNSSGNVKHVVAAFDYCAVRSWNAH